MHQLNLYKKYTMVSKGIVFFLFILLYIAISAPYTLAHKVILFAYVEGDTVFVESGFGDGTVCNNAGIEVFDPSGKKLLEGRTDGNGKFSFKSPRRTDLKLVLDAGMGHREEFMVLAEELPEIAAETRKSQVDFQKPLP